MEELKYPKDEDIKPQWTRFHIGILVFSTLMIWGGLLFKYCIDSSFPPWHTVLSIFGLYVDIIGVLMASLKSPFFGYFFDGGAIEFKREKSDNETFQRGMLLVAIGFVCQAVSLLFQNS